MIQQQHKQMGMYMGSQQVTQVPQQFQQVQQMQQMQQHAMTYKVIPIDNQIQPQLYIQQPIQQPIPMQIQVNHVRK